MARREEKGVLGIRRFQRNTSNAPKTTIEHNLLHIILVIELPPPPRKKDWGGEESNPLVHRVFWHGSAGQDSITQYTYFICGNTTKPSNHRITNWSSFQLAACSDCPACLRIAVGDG